MGVLLPEHDRDPPDVGHVSDVEHVFGGHVAEDGLRVGRVVGGVVGGEVR